MNVTEVCVVMGNVGVLKQSLTNCRGDKVPDLSGIPDSGLYSVSGLGVLKYLGQFLES